MSRRPASDRLDPPSEPSPEGASDPAGGPSGRAKSYWEIVWYQIAQDRFAMVGLVVIVVLFALATLAPVLASSDPFVLRTEDVPGYVPAVRSPESLLAFEDGSGGWISFPWIVGLLTEASQVDFAFNCFLLTLPLALLAAGVGWLRGGRRRALGRGALVWVVTGVLLWVGLLVGPWAPQERPFDFRGYVAQEEARHEARTTVLHDPILGPIVQRTEESREPIEEAGRSAARAIADLSEEEMNLARDAVREAARFLRRADTPAERRLWEATSRLERALGRNPIQPPEVRRRVILWGRALLASPRRTAFIADRVEGFAEIESLAELLAVAREQSQPVEEAVATAVPVVSDPEGTAAEEVRLVSQEALRSATVQLADAPGLQRSVAQAVSTIFGPVAPVMAARFRRLAWTVAPDDVAEIRETLGGGPLDPLLQASVRERANLVEVAREVAAGAAGSLERRRSLLEAVNELETTVEEGAPLLGPADAVRGVLERDRRADLRQGLVELGRWITGAGSRAEPVTEELDALDTLDELLVAARTGGDIAGTAVRVADELHVASEETLRELLSTLGRAARQTSGGSEALDAIRTTVRDLVGDRAGLSTGLLELAEKLLGIGEGDPVVARRFAAEESDALEPLGQAVRQALERLVATSDRVGEELEEDPGQREQVRAAIEEAARTAIRVAPLLRSDIRDVARYLDWSPPSERETVQQLRSMALALAGVRGPSATFAPVPFSPIEDQVEKPETFLLEPSLRHPFGTDTLGRDVFSRMLYGGRVSLTIGFVAVGLYMFIGIIVGALAGYFSGWVDAVISRLIEVMMVFPTFFLILVLVALLRDHPFLSGLPPIFLIMGVIGVTRWTGVARLIRGEFLKLRNEDYVTAGKALGLPETRIMFRHVLPNAIAPALVSATFGIAGAILTESYLSFLGVGIQPPYPSWGLLLKDARFEIFTLVNDLSNLQPLWLLLIPGMAIFLTLTAFNVFGEGLRDALDPKLRRE